MVYFPVEAPTGDYYGGHRPGDNLFSESIIAVDVETGQRVWHFQAVHHGLWDYDFPTHPNLVDITVDGRNIRALAQVSKQGFTYVFDRATGDPVWPIEERPVPQETNLPREVPSLTQPFPTKPPPFEYQGVTIDDLVDFTPEIRALAVEAVRDFTVRSLPHRCMRMIVADQPVRFSVRRSTAARTGVAPAWTQKPASSTCHRTIASRCCISIPQMKRSAARCNSPKARLVAGDNPPCPRGCRCSNHPTRA